ncbi:hypothetical protein [Streptomyces fuscichromogenes]|uniref:Uncharacterized protein n=1 Tax=Streptomyces fuscichromogenes TaxID=1324013 RepID=A0A917XLK8_9ACTN|nr:hypothetical protein [Streptomyces fuscichromogenes]GGN38827.1 hypothetical protein GCM10011578_084630 [Streptomyces fuscichromogenes]
MGLSITVGLLDDQVRNDAEGLAYHRRAFARLTEALAVNGITWQEPEICDPPAVPAVSVNFPHSHVTHLRRLYALAECGELLTPASETDDEQYDRDCQKIQDETAMLASHLLCHADDSGYYIPVDFGEPLFLPLEAGVDGHGMVGSSQRLLAELAGLATPLGIHLNADATLTTAEETALVGFEPDIPFSMEKSTWHQLYRACQASVAGGHAIVFH